MNDRAVLGDNVRAVIGDTPRRREDARFVTGHGAYLDDLRFDGLAHAVFVRSDHPHAHLRGIGTAAALAQPGVIAVLTASDASADGLRPLRPSVEANVQTDEPFRFLPQPVLAEGKLRYVGEPIALVIAETKQQALDAAERVVVDVEPIAAVTQADQALATGAPLLTDEVPGNLCLDWLWGQTDEAAATLQTAAHVVSMDLVNHRIVTNPMEHARCRWRARCNHRPHHAVRVEPEPAHQPRYRREGVRRAAERNSFRCA